VNAAGYSQTITVTGGTGADILSLSAGVLPPGLTFHAATGVLSGTPTTAGTYNFTITATDSVGGSSSQSYAVTINAAPSITTTSLSTWTAHAAYSQAIAVTSGTPGFTYAISSGALPAGLTINPTTGVISGTPTAS
jgi:hypothetical protein